MGPDIDMKFHQEVMEIVSYDTYTQDHITLTFPGMACLTVRYNLLLFKFFALLLALICSIGYFHWF